MATPEQTVICFDFGLKKIGVAIGDTLICEARPLKILTSETKVRRFQLVEAVLGEWRPDLVVVGLPLTLDGKEQPASQHARRFANQVEGRFGYPVVLVDERNSSRQAQDFFDAGNQDDAIAAAIILQRYLDSL